MIYDVFISYSRKDTPLADCIARELEAQGITNFIDRSSIELGDDFAEVIAKSISESEILLFIWTEHSNQSENTANEVALAKMFHKKIVPFKVGSFIPHYKLAYHLVRSNMADEGQGFDEAKLPGLTAEIQRTIETARTERLRIEAEQQVAQIEIKKPTEHPHPQQPLRPECTPPTATAPEPKSGKADERYEMAYQYGRELLTEYKIDEAFGHLIAPALADYKDSQELLSRCLTPVTRLYKILPSRFDEVRRQADEGNAFAQYITAVYLDTVVNDPEQGLRYAEQSMQQGSLFGMTEYAYYLEMGRGVEKNYEKALPRLIKAAQGGNTIALRRLGRNYIYGWSIGKRVEAGLKLLRQGVEQNCPACICELGVLYRFGEVVPKDMDQAEKYFRQAIELGYVEAYEYLGQLAGLNEDGTTKDIQKGYEYFMKGAELSEPNCMFWIGLIYENGLNGRASLPSAIKWYKRAAEAGLSFAYLCLGKIYYYGREGVAEDNKLAWENFEKGSCLLSWNCFYMMGIMCMEGYAPEGKTKADAVVYFAETVFGGSSDAGQAAIKLYELYHEGKWVEQDEQKGIDFLTKAAEYDDQDALVKLGQVLTADLESPYSDEIKGMRYLNRAYEKGSVEAAIILADLYRRGVGTIRNLDKAKELLQFAIDRGQNPQALCEMGKLFSCATQINWDEEQKEVEAEQRKADNLIALEYFKAAAEKQYPEAFCRLTEIAFEEAFADETTSEEGEEWQRRGFEWAQQGAALEYPQSMLDLGVAYHIGVGTDTDTAKSVEWFCKAADAGCAAAAASMGRELISGEKLSIDMPQAYRWFCRAKEMGVNDPAEGFKQFEKMRREHALSLQQSSGMPDILLFREQVLPWKLDCTPEDAWTRSASVTEAECWQNLQKAYIESAGMLKRLTQRFPIPELSGLDGNPELDSVSKIDDLRTDLVKIWFFLRNTLKTKLEELTPVDLEKLLDCAEKTTDYDLQGLLISFTEQLIELNDCFEDLRR